MTLTEMLGIFLVPYGWPFLAYVVLQAVLPIWTRGTKLFWATLLPLLGSVPVLWFTYELGRQRSNLWPMFLILGGMAFLAYEALILLFVLAKGRQSRKKGDPVEVPIVRRPFAPGLMASWILGVGLAFGGVAAGLFFVRSFFWPITLLALVASYYAYARAEPGARAERLLSPATFVRWLTVIPLGGVGLLSILFVLFAGTDQGQLAWWLVPLPVLLIAASYAGHVRIGR